MANSKGPVSLDNPDMEIWGWGVTKDLKEVVKWWRKAADQGDALAQIGLGAMYRDGRGVTRDCKEALRWYRKAAKQGNAAARYDLAAVEKQLRAEGNWPPRSRQAKANPACPDLSRLPVFIIAG